MSRMEALPDKVCLGGRGRVRLPSIVTNLVAASVFYLATGSNQTAPRPAWCNPQDRKPAWFCELANSPQANLCNTLLCPTCDEAGGCDLTCNFCYTTTTSTTSTGCYAANVLTDAVCEDMKDFCDSIFCPQCLEAGKCDRSCDFCTTSTTTSSTTTSSATSSTISSTTSTSSTTTFSVSTTSFTTSTTSTSSTHTGTFTGSATSTISSSSTSTISSSSTHTGTTTTSSTITYTGTRTSSSSSTTATSSTTHTTSPWQGTTTTSSTTMFTSTRTSFRRGTTTTSSTTTDSSTRTSCCRGTSTASSTSTYTSTRTARSVSSATSTTTTTTTSTSNSTSNNTTTRTTRTILVIEMLPHADEEGAASMSWMMVLLCGMGALAFCAALCSLHHHCCHGVFVRRKDASSASATSESGFAVHPDAASRGVGELDGKDTHNEALPVDTEPPLPPPSSASSEMSMSDADADVEREARELAVFDLALQLQGSALADLANPPQSASPGCAGFRANTVTLEDKDAVLECWFGNHLLCSRPVEGLGLHTENRDNWL